MIESNEVLISFSGGRTSAFMAKYMIERHPAKSFHVVFANTGKEREETLDFIHNCDKEFNLNLVWVEFVAVHKKNKGNKFKIVDFETASRNGEPFEDMLKKYGIPNKSYPHCTRELKKRTIKKYMKSLNIKEYFTAIGIRADEEHRINRNTAIKEKLIYPLCDELKVDKEFIRGWWKSQKFDLRLNEHQGNCDMCWKKSFRKLMTLHKESPELLKWWGEMEKKYSKGKYYFFRENKSAFDISEMAKNPFNKFVDPEELKKQAPLLFESNLDIEFDCFCKST